MEKEEQDLKFNEIEDSLLDFNRGTTDLLKHSEVYFILDLVKRFVVKNEKINIMARDGINRKLKEYHKTRQDFKENNSSLVKEWEEYKPTQIKNGLNLGLGFFEWLAHIKKIDYRTFKELKGGIKE